MGPRDRTDMSIRTAESASLRIAGLRWHRHRVPLLRPFVTAARRTEAVEYVVAELVLADGTTGQGSAAETRAVTGESAETIVAALAGPLQGALRDATGTISELAGCIAGALPEATSAQAAAETALHDAWARSLGQPLAALLRRGSTAPLSRAEGEAHPGIGEAGAELLRPLQNDMTVSLEEPATMARHAHEAAQAGYGILKIKLGSDADEDRRRLDAVVEAVPAARLRLDANQGWDAAEAVHIIRALEDDGLPVDLVEQPVPREDLEGMARVRQAVATPIMADEAVWTAQDAARIIEAGAADLLNIKLAKTGGLREALRVADLALEAGLECMVGSMMEPRISITAAAHLAAAHPAVTLIDLDAPAWFSSSAPAGGYEESRGELRLLGGPGLGLEMLHREEDPAG